MPALTRSVGINKCRPALVSCRLTFNSPATSCDREHHPGVYVQQIADSASNFIEPENMRFEPKQVPICCSHIYRGVQNCPTLQSNPRVFKPYKSRKPSCFSYSKHPTSGIYVHLPFPNSQPQPSRATALTSLKPRSALLLFCLLPRLRKSSTQGCVVSLIKPLGVSLPFTPVY